MQLQEFKKTEEKMLQQTPKKDKKARAELTEKLKKMENDMKQRHEAELKVFEDQVNVNISFLLILLTIICRKN